MGGRNAFYERRKEPTRPRVFPWLFWSPPLLIRPRVWREWPGGSLIPPLLLSLVHSPSLSRALSLLPFYCLYLRSLCATLYIGHQNYAAVRRESVRTGLEGHYCVILRNSHFPRLFGGEVRTWYDPISMGRVPGGGGESYCALFLWGMWRCRLRRWQGSAHRPCFLFGFYRAEAVGFVCLRLAYVPSAAVTSAVFSSPTFDFFFSLLLANH